MSASREKKKRQANGAVDPKAARAAEQRAAERKSNLLYGTIAVVFVVVAVALVVYNSGIIQRSQTAVTIDGEKYNVAETAYYYQSAYQSFMSQSGYLYTALGMLDTSQPLKNQAYDDERSWADYFQEQAVDTMRFVHAATAAAKADGMSLESEDLESFDATVEARKSEAASYGYSYKSYLAAMFGSVMTPSIYESCLKDQLLASKYATAHYDGLEYSEDEIESYYKENKDTYDLVDGAYVLISGSPETELDEDGNVIEATDEEKAAAMEAAKETAEEILAAYEDGEDLEKLAEDHDASYTGGTELSSGSNAALTWLFDSSRKAGNAEVIEDTSGYYVAVFNGRERDDTLDYNVRHIRITADSLELGEGEEATEEMLRAKAQEILDIWDGTEEGFASLAEEYSQDPGSNTNGGLYEDVPKNYMIAAFQDWCYEDGRKSGDTGIVYSSSTGAHIMYFVGYGDTEYWHYACESMLRSNEQTEWENGLRDSVTAEINESGMKSVV